MKVLIVDDEKIISNAIKNVCKLNGIETEVSKDGLDAIDKLKKNKYDVILLDYVMPRANGLQVLLEMQKMDLKTPVIMLSGINKTEIIEQSSNYVNMFLHKDTLSKELKEIPNYIHTVYAGGVLNGFN